MTLLHPDTTAEFADRTRSCTRCALRPNCISPVSTEFATVSAPHGRGGLLIVGEAPGPDEDRRTRPFVGQSGQEVERMLLHRLGLQRAAVTISKLVRCRPPGNRTPEEAEITACLPHLLDEIAAVRPRVILALGATAGRALAADYVDMEFSWATVSRPVPAVARHAPDAVVVVSPHPAFCLRAPRMFNRMSRAFDIALSVLEHGHRFDDRPVTVIEAKPGDIPDSFPRIAMDTETDEAGNPVCYSWSFDGETAYVEWVPTTGVPGPCARKLAALVPHVEVILHNAPFDVPVLAKLGIRVAAFRDSMAAAFMLGDEPGGLKSLAWRHGGLRMQSYASIVDPVGRAIHWELLKITAWDPEGANRELSDPCAKTVRKLASPDLAETIARAYGATDKQAKSWGAAFLWRSLTGRAPDKTPKKLGLALAELEPDFKLPIDKPSTDTTKLTVAKLVPPMPVTLHHVDHDAATTYSGTDAAATMRVWDALERRLVDTDLARAEAIEMAATPMVLAYGETGVYVSGPELEALYTEWSEARVRVAACLAAHADALGWRGLTWKLDPETGFPGKDEPAPFNPASPLMVGRLLYDLEKNPVQGYTDGGSPATDDAVLLRLAESGSLGAGFMLEWRMWNNLVSMHVEPLRRALARSTDGRVHPRYSLARAETGRLASSDPNILNVPSRDPEGARLRTVFRAEPGWLLVGADYSQVELRLLAGLALDRNMISAFLSGEDLHAKTACLVFGIDPAKFDKSIPAHKLARSVAKIVNFGIPYGVGPSGLRDQLHAQGLTHYTEPMCRKIIDDWYAAFSGVKAFFDERHAEAVRTGFVRCWSGRRRAMAQARSATFHIASEARRECCNTPIQGGAGEVVKLAMGALWKEAMTAPYPVKCLFQMHDALYFEVEAAYADHWAAVVKRCMEAALEHPALGLPGFPVPLDVEVHTGERWSDV